MYDDEWPEEQVRQAFSPVKPLGRSVQSLIDELLKVEDKSAIVTVLVEGNTREVFTLSIIEDCPQYTTGARTFIKVT